MRSSNDDTSPPPLPSVLLTENRSRQPAGHVPDEEEAEALLHAVLRSLSCLDDLPRRPRRRRRCPPAGGDGGCGGELAETAATTASTAEYLGSNLLGEGDGGDLGEGDGGSSSGSSDAVAPEDHGTTDARNDRAIATEREWAAGVALLRLLLRTTSPSPSPPPPPLSPHLLLRSALDHSLDLGADRPTAPTSGGCGPSSMAVLLVLLGVASLRAASRETRAALVVPGGGTVRWRRLSSMAMECVELYQRAVLRPADEACRGGGGGGCGGRAHRSGSAVAAGGSAMEAAALLGRYVGPAVCDLLAALEAGSRADPAAAAAATKASRVVPAVEAGLVASAAGVVRLLSSMAAAEGTADGSSGDAASGAKAPSDLTAELMRSVLLLPTLRVDEILVHPVRRWAYEHKRKRGGGDVDMVVEEEDEDQDGGDVEGYSFSALVCGSPNPGDLCGMATRWDEVGIAYLAYRALSLRWEAGRSASSSSPSAPPSSGVELLLSYAHSARYLFAMIYPHVEVLLALGQVVDDRGDGDSDSDSNGGGDDRGSISAADKDAAAMHTRAGVDMLRLVLRTIPPSAHAGLGMLGGPKSWFDGGPAARDVEGPLGPVGCVQLLLNLAVSLQEENSDVSAPVPKVGVGSKNRPSRGEILSLVRDLLGCYRPEQHVRSIGRLLGRCPYPFLEPVLLDLLRPALTVQPLIGDGPSCSVSAVPADQVEEGVLGVLSPYLGGMLRHISPPDGKAWDLSDLDGMIGAVETYVCAASLVRLLCLQRQQCEGDLRICKSSATTAAPGDFDLDDAVNTIVDLHRGLKSLLEIWSERDGAADATASVEIPDAPSDYYRLYLLEDALAEVVRTKIDSPEIS